MRSLPCPGICPSRMLASASHTAIAAAAWPRPCARRAAATPTYHPHTLLFTHPLPQVLELTELDRLRHSYIGELGVSGLSVEQRKRLTIAVELVANPSIVFM